MLHSLKLLLPALIPSWRFFDWIAPSPRIEIRVGEGWQEFRPRPARLTATDLLKRLFWNPSWNESLYLVSCAERLMQTGSEHSRREILKRIAPATQFRLVFLHREGTEIKREETYRS